MWVWYECFYLEEGKPLVSIEDDFEALVVDQREESGVSQVVYGHWEFLQSHSHGAPSGGWGELPQQTRSKVLDCREKQPRC